MKKWWTGLSDPPVNWRVVIRDLSGSVRDDDDVNSAVPPCREETHAHDFEAKSDYRILMQAISMSKENGHTFIYVDVCV